MKTTKAERDEWRREMADENGDLACVLHHTDMSRLLDDADRAEELEKELHAIHEHMNDEIEREHPGAFG